MTSRRIATRQEWLAASAPLLEREKLAGQRRELPWVPLEYHNR